MKNRKIFARVLSMGMALALACGMLPVQGIRAQEPSKAEGAAAQDDGKADQEGAANQEEASNQGNTAVQEEEKNAEGRAGKEETETETGKESKEKPEGETGEEAGTGQEAEEEKIPEIVEINTVEDFLTFADHCFIDAWSSDKRVLLNADIDLTGTDFEAIPVFAGTFDGQGHTISGFSYSGGGYVAGLFRYIEKSGLVENLKLKGEIIASDEKECIGSFCGVNYGTIKKCSFQGNVSGRTTVGGLAGVNEGTGSILNSYAGGRVTGYYSTGGLVGKNHGSISNCINRTCVNNDSEWVEEDDEMGVGLFLSITISDSDTEMFSGVDTGGIAGYSDGLITRCTNYGRVGYEHTGYNIGGIAGRQSGVVSYCTNDGAVYGRKDVGGIVGQMEPFIEIDEATSLRNAVDKLHDLIEKTIDDMEDGKNAVKGGFDDLASYSEKAADAGDALAGQIGDFADGNLDQAQAVADRAGHVMDMLPDVFDDVYAAEEGFSNVNKELSALLEKLGDMGSMDGEYVETDYNRLSLLSTVGGSILSIQRYPEAGETVHVMVEPNRDYGLKVIRAVDAKGNGISMGKESEKDYTFVMPEANVKVEAYFEYQGTEGEYGDEELPAPGITDENGTAVEETEENGEEGKEDLEEAGGTDGTGGADPSGETSAPGGTDAAGEPNAAGTTGGTDTAGGTDAAGGTNVAGGTNTTGGPNASGEMDASGGTDTTGGTNASGGTDTTGGTNAPGGTDTAGGMNSVGGTNAAGGTNASGGTNAAGGMNSVGGTNVAGGTNASGGTNAAGGINANGGTDTTGGTNVPGGTDAAGEKNPAGSPGTAGETNPTGSVGTAGEPNAAGGAVTPETGGKQEGSLPSGESGKAKITVNEQETNHKKEAARVPGSGRMLQEESFLYTQKTVMSAGRKNGTDVGTVEEMSEKQGLEREKAVIIQLSSNLSGNASYGIDGDTAMVTVIPDGAYTVNGIPVVTAGGQNIPVSKSEKSEFSYTFQINGGGVYQVSITFQKRNQSQSVGSAKNNISNAIKEQQAAAEKVNAVMKEIQESGSASPEQLSRLAEGMSEMSDATSAIMSNLNVVSNIAGQQAADMADAIGDSMGNVSEHLYTVTDSVKSATRDVRSIVDYVNGQSDIRFSKLGAEFDVNRENLRSQLQGMADSLKELSGNASDYSDVINEDLRAVNHQINVIFNLLADNVMNYSDLSIEELYEDVDIEDTASITTGKADTCTNKAVVKGDINVGGIAGAMSIDEEDPEDSAAGSVDYEIGRRYFTKCIITGSVNEGFVTAKKDGAGGIVGYMRHGIVVDSEGYGGVESTEGSFVGGICGESFTVIKRCYALCSVSGKKNVGGIAGYADTLKDCYAMADCHASVGRKGAIAGQTVDYDDALDEEEDKVSDNYYVGENLYGIDDISYAGIAEPISYEELLAVENLPQEFRHLKVTFRVEDSYLGTQEVAFGEGLAWLNYPEIPEKEGYYGIWEDCSDKIMTGNLLVEGEYKEDVTVVESSEKQGAGLEDGYEKPYALVEQRFTENTVLSASISDREPPEKAGGRENVVYDILLENAEIQDTDTFAIRLYNPYKDAVVWGYKDGLWTELESKTRGEYVQVDMTGAEQSFCVAEHRPLLWIAVAGTAGGLAVLLLAVLVGRKRRAVHRAKNRR